MNRFEQYGIAPHAIPWLFIFMGIFLLLLIDPLPAFQSLYLEGYPILRPPFILRSLVLFAILFMFFINLTRNSYSDLGNVSLTHGRFAFSATILVTLLSFLIFILFLIKPGLFSYMSLEDGVVEWGSVLFLLGACFFLLASFNMYIRDARNYKYRAFISVLFSVALFVVAMEEISWFQRVLEFETPVAFVDNEQKEFNLHNFYTTLSENLYYLGSFLFLILLPFIFILFPNMTLFRGLKELIPRPFIIVIASLAFCLNFDMWNGLITQATFFASIIILLLLSKLMRSTTDRYCVFIVICLAVIQQFTYLITPTGFMRIWEITEYKEFLIPIAFFIYSVDSFYQIKLITSNLRQKRKRLAKLNI